MIEPNKARPFVQKGDEERAVGALVGSARPDSASVLWWAATCRAPRKS